MAWCIIRIMKRTVLSLLLFSSAIVFGHPLDKAWVKGVTDRDPLSYGIGERMTFTLTVEGVADTLPAGEYFLHWTRSGDDGLREEGQVPLDGRPFVYATQIAKAGFVRLQAHVADKDGKKYRKPFTGDVSTPAGKAGMRPWIWSDYIWHHKQEFLSKMPKDVLQSNWFYGDSFKTGEPLAKGHECNRVDAYLELEKAGFDQVPTGSNWSCDANLRGTVDFCRRHVSPSRLKGFMMAPWFFPDPRWEDKLMDACRLGREAFRA